MKMKQARKCRSRKVSVQRQTGLRRHAVKKHHPPRGWNELAAPLLRRYGGTEEQFQVLLKKVRPYFWKCANKFSYPDNEDMEATLEAILAQTLLTPKLRRRIRNFEAFIVCLVRHRMADYIRMLTRNRKLQIDSLEAHGDALAVIEAPQHLPFFQDPRLRAIWLRASRFERLMMVTQLETGSLAETGRVVGMSRCTAFKRFRDMQQYIGCN